MTTPGFVTGGFVRNSVNGDVIFDNLRILIPELDDTYGNPDEFAADVADAARYVRQHEAFHRITDIFAPVIVCEGEPEATENTEQKEDQ